MIKFCRIADNSSSNPIRFIVKLGDIKTQSELEMSTSLIERNFSNYSAWHYRTTLLDTENMGVVREELEWAQNAYFTGRFEKLKPSISEYLTCLILSYFVLSCHLLSYLSPEIP